MTSNPVKREVPPRLRNILEKDVELTKKFVLWSDKYLPLESFRIHYKMLEFSCHGIPWFAFWIAFTWLFNNQSLVQLQVNMLFGLLLDIVFVAVIKAYTRRRRPMKNTDDALGHIGPDKYSFPSGHTSRAVFVTFFFIYLYSLPIIFWPTLLAWAVAVSLSRILFSRHYILDVVAGMFLGFIEGILLNFFWLSEDTSVWIMSSLSDEKLEGGSYHV